MGVPKFFKYISERYPCLSELVKEFQIPDFDNLYLDMNGIIHVCSHPNDFEPHFSITEEKIFASIFHYVEVLFNMIKPRKLFFMAVDGVAPRAKMNNQRGRRFRTAKEAEIKDKEALAKNDKPLPKDRFDSNCITPGTLFMARLHSQLKYFVTSKISTDPLWQGCKVVLSGHQTPGEGEHKIMDYIRYLKTLPDYDPNTRHCLYGLDTDLLMLGLCTHEPHFSLLREKVRYSRQHSKRMTSPDETKFYLLHLSLLREYLDLEFQDLKETLPFQYNLENIIDDWVLMGFLVGNDFIPNLPDLHINKGALPILYKAYKEVLPTLDGYLNENGYLNLARFEQYLEEMAKFDLEKFENTYANLAFWEEKNGRNLLAEKWREKFHKVGLSFIFNVLSNGEVNIRKWKINGCPAVKSDLEELIKATDEFELSDEDWFEEHEHDTFLWEFSQHKRNYYTDKLDCRQVTPEVLKSQAEDYIRAIQWNLHYYYQGCQSWSWYYPYHYSPYISDIKNFKGLKLDFDMGKPFLPFEQLLAVLPAASKNLLPEPYHYLMTSSDSPIKDYYPEDFETDLNGKEQDWEAVVLIPFIDEQRLLEAMKTPNEKLSPEEAARNRHGPMHVFTYTDEDLGLYHSPGYFPNLPSNHALLENVSAEDIAVEKGKLQFGLRPGVLLGVLNPGFPTMNHISFKACLKVARVKVFDCASKGDNMILTLDRRELPSLKALAQDLLGKIVYVNWPHLVESRAVAVSDGKVRYSITDNDCPVSEVLDKAMQKQWMGEAENAKSTYMNRLGVDVGSVEVLVYAATLEGGKYAFGPKGRVMMEKVWSALPQPSPLQVVVQDFPVERRRSRGYGDLKDAFPDDSVVFMLGQPNFGSMGRVLDATESHKNSRVKVAFETVTEPVIQDSLMKYQPKTVYLPCRVAAYKAGVNSRLFSRITGVVLVSITKEGSNGEPKINIGLNMKFTKKDEEIPGYTKKEKDNWLYSTAAINIVCEYVQKFSRVIEYLANHQNAYFYFVQDIFPGLEGPQEMSEMVTWVKKQEHHNVERFKCGTERLESEVIARLEEMVQKQPVKCVVCQMKVKPQLLYKSDLVFGNVPPVKSAKHCLLDRVVSVRASYTVPTGLRGYIVGIHPAPLDADYMYDILFDRPFLGGMKGSSSAEKMFRMSRASFLNITDAARQSSRPAPVRFDPVSNTNVILRPSYGDTKTSAFAQWTHHSPHPSPDVNEEFKEIWLNLHRAQPQEDALKKILKIEKQHEPDIAEPVKWFFDKITKTPNDSPRVPNNAPPPTTPPIQTLPPRNSYHRQLLSLYKRRNLGLPSFKYLYIGPKVMAQVFVADGRVCSGLPCDDKESACESASLQALGALGEAPFNYRPTDRSLPLPHPLLGPAPPTPQRPPPHLGNTVPSALPSPPSQWVIPNLPQLAHHSRRENPPPHPLIGPPAPEQPRLASLPTPPTHHVLLKASANGRARKLNASILEFVPLQAITGKRHSGRVTANHVPAQRAEPQKKTAVVATFFNAVGTAPSTNRPKRRSKIAAKLDFDPNLY